MHVWKKITYKDPYVQVLFKFIHTRVIIIYVLLLDIICHPPKQCLGTNNFVWVAKDPPTPK